MRLFLIFLLAGICFTVNAQKSIGIDLAYSAGGHGLLYSPIVTFFKGDHRLGAAVCLQKANVHFSGLRFNYKYVLTTTFKEQELFLEHNLIYRHNAYLSNKLQLAFANGGLDLFSVRFNTFEQFTGFGFKSYLLNNIFWDAAMGIGSYFSLSQKNYPVSGELSSLRLSKNIGFLVRAGFSYKFNNFRKSAFMRKKHGGGKGRRSGRK